MKDFFNTVKNAKNKIVKEFDLSRTGSETDVNKFPNLKRMNEYKNRFKEQKIDAWAKYDNQLVQIRDSSKDLSEFYQKAKSNNYANCTTQAMFLSYLLTCEKVESRIFNVAGRHHLVIAKYDNKDEQDKIILSDPWADFQCEISLKKPVKCLDDLKIKENLANLLCILDIVEKKYKNYSDTVSFHKKNTLSDYATFNSIFRIDSAADYLTNYNPKEPATIFHDKRCFQSNKNSKNTCLIS